MKPFPFSPFIASFLTITVSAQTETTTTQQLAAFYTRRQMKPGGTRVAPPAGTIDQPGLSPYRLAGATTLPFARGHVKRGDLDLQNAQNLFHLASMNGQMEQILREKILASIEAPIPALTRRDALL